MFEFFFLYHYNPFKKPVVTFSFPSMQEIGFSLLKLLVMLDY